MKMTALDPGGEPCPCSPLVWRPDVGTLAELAYRRHMDHDAAIAASQANWDERVPSHLSAQGVEDFIANSQRISSVVCDDLALMVPHLSGGSLTEHERAPIAADVSASVLVKCACPRQRAASVPWWWNTCQ